MGHDVFISYSSEDEKVAYRVWEYLRAKKLNPWMAPQSIPPGKPYARSIIDGISECRLMVVILSRASNDSENVLNEIDQAHREKKVILPFIVDQMQMSGEMSYYLSRKQWITAYPDVTSAQCEELYQAIGSYIPIPQAEKPREADEVIRPQVKRPIDASSVRTEPQTGVDRGENMMEKFPELGLVPTTLYDWRKPKKSRIVALVCFILAFLPFLFCELSFFDRLTIDWDGTPLSKAEMDIVRSVQEDGVGPKEGTVDEGDKGYYLSYLWYTDWARGTIVQGSVTVRTEDIPDERKWGQTEEDVRSNVAEVIEKEKAVRLKSIKREAATLMIVYLLFTLPFLFLGYLFYAPYPTRTTPPLRLLADYIQRYRYTRWTRMGKKPQYVFFAKSRLFGVMDVADYKERIPPRYDKISWKVKDSLINVSQNGHNFTIDINGKRLG